MLIIAGVATASDVPALVTLIVAPRRRRRERGDRRGDQLPGLEPCAGGLDRGRPLDRALARRRPRARGARSERAPRSHRVARRDPREPAGSRSHPRCSGRTSRAPPSARSARTSSARSADGGRSPCSSETWSHGPWFPSAWHDGRCRARTCDADRSEERPMRLARESRCAIEALVVLAGRPAGTVTEAREIADAAPSRGRSSRRSSACSPSVACSGRSGAGGTRSLGRPNGSRSRMCCGPSRATR